jgi:hypothetical protein
MAMANNRMLAWIWQGTAADRRTGFVEVTRAAFQQMESQGRAQDPRTCTALQLKHITPTLWTLPLAPAPAPEPPPRRRRASASEA